MIKKFTYQLTKILLILLPLSVPVFSQDFHLSQYEASSMLLNPAMTGMFKGGFRIALHQRDQWATVVNNPFLTSAISVDGQIGKANLGGFVINSRAGAIGYNSMTAVISGSYVYSVPKNPYHNFAIGGQAGIIQKTINISKLELEDMYNGVNRGTFDQPTGESFQNTRVIIPELNLGFLYYYASSTSRFNPFLGFSSSHLTQPKETFLLSSSQLPRRDLIHLGSKYSFNEKVQVSVHGIGMKQKNITELMSSVIGYYFLKDFNAHVLYGFTVRNNKDAKIMHLGLNLGKFTYRFSYDLNTSALASVSRGRGGFEISIVYIGRRTEPKQVRSCPSL